MRGPMTTRADLDRLIPWRSRALIEAGRIDRSYVVSAPDYDRLPIDTFLISTEPGTGGRVFWRVTRIVRPNSADKYPAKYLTDYDRLLFVCWRNGMAVKSLDEPKRADYRHIVLPGDPQHDRIAAFKILCDTKRAWNQRPMRVAPTLLYDAFEVPLDMRIKGGPDDRET